MEADLSLDQIDLLAGAGYRADLQVHNAVFAETFHRNARFRVERD